MSRLVALVFDDERKADEARAGLSHIAGDGHLDVDETAVVVKGVDGTVRISHATGAAGRGTRIGRLLGLVNAAVAGAMPFVLAGTASGRPTDGTVTKEFITDIGRKLRPGTSALVLLARSDHERPG